jgi:hypothetical protein
VEKGVPLSQQALKLIGKNETCQNNVQQKITQCKDAKQNDTQQNDS